MPITYIKRVFKWTSTSERDINLAFILQKPIKDAAVNILSSLIRASSDWVDLLQDGNIIRTTIIEVDQQKWNTSWRCLSFKPSESGKGWLTQTLAYKN